jgi:hypothetical protein
MINSSFPATKLLEEEVSFYSIIDKNLKAGGF